MKNQRLSHLLIANPTELISFTSISSGGSRKRIPLRDRDLHSKFLRERIREAWKNAKNEQAVAHATRSGIYLEFKSDPDADLIVKSLEDMHSKQVRLLNVRKESVLVIDDTTGEVQNKVITYATVFVHKDKAQYFSRKLEDYATKTTESGNPKNADLINSIADVYNASLVDSFWQDDKGLTPVHNREWCEVWLSSASESVITQFDELISELNIQARAGVLRFPERAVKIIYANHHELEQLSIVSDDIAEYRRAKETATFWTDLPNRDQAEWLTNLLDRLRVNHDTNVSVCILDTGVNYGHPLLAPILAETDCQAVKADWLTHDHNRHGTLMAGIVGYGNLMNSLASNEPVDVRHRLESVKILPLPPNETIPELWGYMTSQAISRAEIQAPERKRIICMAVSATDTRDRGRPSSWSAEIDQVASGAEDDARRLIIICAGNNTDSAMAQNYPHAQIGDSIHDPAQSWNALTVGAYTTLDQISDPTLAGYKPIAPKGGLSPFTTTSVTWDDKWPIKPEIMFEGGNMALNGAGFATEHDDLSLLSTFYQPQNSHFQPFNMTSAATAQAAWFAAQIQASYPDFWPETIRALMVHSAKWPEGLTKQFGGDGKKTTIKRLMRICGYGVPDLERALYSAANSLTLIAQSELQPFDRKEGGGYRTKDMHFYDLPWPREVLLNLPDTTEVEMRITLSYFIEPGPGEIGWQDRYRYASHLLRFELNSPGESRGEFVRRINQAAREEEGHPGTQSASDHWVIGSQTRDKGSIHSDIWRGTAADLASSNLIAISPGIGWWRERAHLNRWNRKTRYALIVSIDTSEEAVDIYTPVAAQIGINVPIIIQA